MHEQTTSGYRHGHQDLPHYTSQAGGVVVSPSYMDYMAGYPPKPLHYWDLVEYADLHHPWVLLKCFGQVC